MRKWMLLLVSLAGSVWMSGDADAAQLPRESRDPYRLNILDFGPVDQAGVQDDSAALANVVTAANRYTEAGKPACVYIPAGIYRIVTPPPPFALAGCIEGDGSAQSILSIDARFTGDLFAWSEAWAATTPGPTVVGLQIRGDRTGQAQQNAFVFYDRNDNVYMSDVTVNDLHGRVLYSGVTRAKPQAYMRESHFTSLRFFNDGAPGVPVIEFNSQGTAESDATNEIRLSQVDIYGAAGPGLVIRNNGSSGVRNITFEALRIEGLQQKVFGASQGDLLAIGDPVMGGSVNNIRLTDVELIDAGSGYCAFRMSAPSPAQEPYQITMQGAIGGGQPYGQGLCISSGRSSVFRLSGIHSFGTNVVVGANVTQLVLDGGGQEASWSYSIDPTSVRGVSFPALSPYH